MTSFEQQIADAICRDRFNGHPCRRCEDIAPRVAAAIEAAQNATSDLVPWAVLHVHGYEWTPAQQEKNVADIRGRALAALRGSAPEAPDP